MNILIISEALLLDELILDSLKEYEYNLFLKNDVLDITSFVLKKNIDIVILNLYNKKISEDEITIVSELKVKKIIVLENGNDIYQKNTSLPFSVFKKLTFRNAKSKIIKQNEEIIKNSKSNYIIFRISEIYGPSVQFGLIYDLFHENIYTLNDGERDFLYEGDLIYAIERAIQCDAIGIFDIAFGQSIKMKDLVFKINEIKKKQIKIIKKKEKIVYTCKNFQFYKWQPLVDFDAGLNAMRNNLKNSI